MKPNIKGKRQALGLTLEEVGNYVGVGKSTVRKWEVGDIENMKRDKIMKLADILKVTPLYIMGMADDNEEEKEIIPADQVPVLSEISAGQPLYAEQNLLGYAHIPSFLNKTGKELFYLKVDGDSMDKEFKEGDLVLVEKDAPVENGQIAVMLINGDEATVKRVRYNEEKVILYPESHDASHLPQVYNGEDELSIVGRVISSQKFY